MFTERDQARVEFKIRNNIVQAVLVVKHPDRAGEAHSREVVDCVIDTGATRTTIPERIWTKALTRAEALQSGFIERTAKGVGGEVTVLEGELSLELLGTNFRTGGAVDLGMCEVWLALDRTAGRPMMSVLFGVGGGCMDRGGICINWKRPSAHYVEVK